MKRAAFYFHVFILHGGETIGTIFFFILIVSNADKCMLHKADHHCDHFFLREFLFADVLFYFLPETRKDFSELNHAMKLGFIPVMIPKRMIPVLFSLTHVKTRNLQMAVMKRADPNPFPGGRNYQILYS